MAKASNGRANGVLPLDHARVIARFFQALADPTRARMLYALAHGPWSVTELAHALEMDQPAISHQLRYLRETGLVSYTRSGKRVYYALADAHMRAVLLSSLHHIQDQIEDERV